MKSRKEEEAHRTKAERKKNVSPDYFVPHSTTQDCVSHQVGLSHSLSVAASPNRSGTKLFSLSVMCCGAHRSVLYCSPLLSFLYFRGDVSFCFRFSGWCSFDASCIMLLAVALGCTLIWKLYSWLFEGAWFSLCKCFLGWCLVRPGRLTLSSP